MKEKLINNSFELTVLVVCSLAYIIFCNYLMIELPYLAWFSSFSLINNFYEHSLTFSQLMNTFGEHGLFGYNILFLINVVFFNLTTLFDVYINDAIVIIIGVVSIFAYKKSIKDTKSLFYKFSIIVMCLFIFSFIQYSSGSMETQVRLGILFFVFAAIMIDRIFHETVTRKYLIGTIVMILFSINIFGTAYSFAGIPVIFLIVLIKSIKNKKLNKYQVIICITYLFSMVLYFIQYRVLGQGHMKSSGMLLTLIEIITNPIYSIKGLLAYNASTILGYPVYADKIISDHNYLTIGLIVTFIQIYSVFRFISSKLYVKSKLPVIFIGYSLFVLFLIMLGRYSNDWGWYVNLWYTVHTKFAAIGYIWILTYDFKNIAIKDKYRIISICSLVFLAIGIIFGNFIELKRVPYERAYYLEKQPYLFAQNINELPLNENGLTPLLQSPEITMYAIHTLREHGLSVYKYYKPYEQMQRMQGRDIGNTLSTSYIISGINNDGWLEKSCEFKIKTGSNGKLVFKGYYPKKITGNETGVIYINDKATTFTISETNFTIEVSAPIQSVVKVKIENGFAFSAEPPDTRKLSFILSDVQGQ